MLHGSLGVPTLVCIVEDAVFLLVAQTYAVADVLAATRNVDEVVLLCSGAQYKVLPVGISLVLILVLPYRTVVTPNQFFLCGGHFPSSDTSSIVGR